MPSRYRSSNGCLGSAELAPTSAGLTVVEIVNAVHAGHHPKGLYVMGENPAMSDPDTAHASPRSARQARASRGPGSLPHRDRDARRRGAAGERLAEKDGTATNTNRQVQRGRKAVPLPGEARQDWEIIQSIAQGLGLEWSYDGVGEIFEEMRQVMPSIAGISWERVSREDVVIYPCSSEDDPGQEIVFSDAFPTPTGRGLMVPADIVPPDEEPDETFPMILTTGRLLEHWHTGAMTRRATLLDSLEPEAVAMMAPGDMRRLAIAPGDTIRISTRRGTIEAKVRTDAGLQPGMVFVPFCYATAAANMLTNPALDPFGKIPEFKFCAARVEHAAGAEGVH